MRGSRQGICSAAEIWAGAGVWGGCRMVGACVGSAPDLIAYKGERFPIKAVQVIADERLSTVGSLVCRRPQEL